MTLATHTSTNTHNIVKAPTRAPLRTAMDKLIEDLIRLRTPRVSMSPDGEEIRALGDHLTNFATAVDTYIKAVGTELASNSPAPIDRSQFDQVVFKGIDGFALYEIEQVAEEWSTANSQYGVGA